MVQPTRLAARRLVVVAELQPNLSFEIARWLYPYNNTVDVLLAASPEVTRVLLESYRVASLVVGVDPQSPSGVLSLRRAGAEFPETGLVAVADQLSESQQSYVFACGADRLIGSDDAALVVNTLTGQAPRQEVLRGELSNLDPADVLQSACIAKRTLTLRFRSPEGRAVVWVVEGAIRHAVWNDKAGLWALSRVLAMATGVVYGYANLPVPKVSIMLDWQAAILESARLSDEANVGDSKGARIELVRARDAGLERGGATLDADPGVESEVVRAPQSTAAGIDAHEAAAGREGDDEYTQLTQLGMRSLQAGDLASAQRYWNAARVAAAAGTTAGPDVRTHARSVEPAAS